MSSPSTPQQFARLKKLFFECLDVPAQERDGKLVEACAGDVALAAEARKVLAADPGGADPLLAVPDLGGSAMPPAFELSVGDQIGHYRLMEQLGEGGMGIVYVAEQKEPVRRQVALKIIKPGMDSRQVVARFEAERQALAMMDHPHIARVFDGGTTDQGRPFFVMELVKGVPITEFCDQEKLPIAERLKLFVQVCHAVQHAHQKGVIHRDLKPSNVLVTRHDTTPVPKVIDFGVAKAIHQPLTEKTIYSHVWQMLGTPTYMSPEQAELNGLDVDTRSDVYSLGVLLYELLTGTTPFDVESLRKAGLDELRRKVREDDPAQPSERVCTLKADAGSTASQRRGVDLRRLKNLLRGELDWIVMKALEKDRVRRYQSAAELSADISRYLVQQPVDAGPPSRVYRLRKFVRRHCIALTAAGGIALALLVGAGVSLWQAHEAIVARDSLEAALDQAERDRAIAEAVNDFLNYDLLGMADLASQARPGITPDADIKLRTVLDRAATKIEGHFPDEPLIEAALLMTIGQSYFSLGEYATAQRFLERAHILRSEQLGDDDAKTIDACEILAVLYGEQSNHQERVRILLECLERRREQLGDAAPETLITMNHLGAAYVATHQYDKAVPLLLTSLEGLRVQAGENNASTLAIMNNLATAYSEQGQRSKAVPQYQRCLQIQERIQGKDHPDYLTTLHNLAETYSELGKCREAEPLHRECLERNLQIHKFLHPHVIGAMHSLAMCLHGLNKLHEARPYYERCLELQQKGPGEMDPTTQSKMADLARLFREPDK